MSNTKPSKKLVPPQEEGSKSDTAHSVTMKTEDEARELFDMAKNRLLDIANWDKLCGLVTGKFHLTDSQGNQINGLAKVNDYLKIDVPGPGSETGHGFDWVRVEAIEEDNPDSDSEELVMKVRPASNPNNNDDNTAHFFKEEATSTFIVKREKNIVSAEVHGRNELANVKQDSPLDKLRNALTALSAMLGFSSTQWKKLVKGLVSLKKLR